MIFGPPKHPDSSKWYWLEWDACEFDAATVASATWTVPAGLTSVAEDIAGRSAGIKLGGGTLGASYDIGLAVVTTAGETLHETLRLRCDSRGH